MTSPRFRAVISDAEYPDVAQERAILEGIGAELIREQVKDEDALIPTLAGAEVILTQYAPLTARVIATLDRCRGIVRYDTMGCGAEFCIPGRG